MALLWTDDASGAEEDRALGGEWKDGGWKDGVFVPSKQWPPRGARASMVRDVIRTLLDLRAT